MPLPPSRIYSFEFFLNKPAHWTERSDLFWVVYSFCNTAAWLCILPLEPVSLDSLQVLSLISCVTLDKLLNFSEVVLPCQSKGDDRVPASLGCEGHYWRCRLSKWISFRFWLWGNPLSEEKMQAHLLRLGFPVLKWGGGTVLTHPWLGFLLETLSTLS